MRSAVLPRTRAVVLDRWHVVYVVTPKVMCTSLLWTMARLQEESLADVGGGLSPEVTRALLVHDPTTWRHTPLLHELPARDIERVIKSEHWFRFCLTRHPVDRLWSAWQSKLLLREPAYVSRFGTERWFPRVPAGIRAVLEDFERFVGALNETPGLLTADEHWAPQEWLLRADAFPYTTVGRLEDAPATLRKLEEHLRGRGWTGTLGRTRRNISLLPRQVLRDPVLLRQIEELYAGDLVAFEHAPARVGRQPAGGEVAVAVRALGEIVERHERIADLHRLVTSSRTARGGGDGAAGSGPRRSVQAPPRLAMVYLPDSRDRSPAIPAGACIPDDVEAVIVPPADMPVTAAAFPDSRVRVLPPSSAAGAAARFQSGVDSTVADVVVLCRNVTELSPGWSERVLDALDNPEVALVGAVVEPAGQSGVRLAGLEFVDEVLNCRWRTASVAGPCVPVPLLSSTFLAVRRRALSELGGLDTGMLGDDWHDVDLSLRAWRSGRSCIVLPDVVAVWRPPPEQPHTLDFVHDLLRLAMVHVSRGQLAGIVEALRGAPVLSAALAEVVTSDVGGRRARLDAKAVRAIDHLLPAPRSAGALATEEAS